MKLNLVPARVGITWVKRGMRTFFRQPLALTGLFFIFMAVMSVLSMVPLLGNVLALAVLPGATLGLMAASKEASNGKFPMPKVLLSGFNAGRQQLRAMLTLGAIYTSGILLVLAVSALADGGSFARLYLLGDRVSEETMRSDAFELAVVISMGLYMPLSLLFWHAPALVHWYGISPVKSLFFSMVACLRNFWTFAVYSIAWLAAFLVTGLAVALLAALVGSPEDAGAAMFPVAMLIAAMFFTSIYFTFEDCFSSQEAPPPHALP